MFFISVASKELRVYVSGLESTLADISVSVDSKWVRGGMISHLFEGRRGRSRSGDDGGSGECGIGGRRRG